MRVTDGESKITLYHHWDGYPSNMMPLIREAWEKWGQGWEGARVGKVAGMLCASDPAGYEPEDGHTLHADIEYFYEIDCKDTMHSNTKPKWKVTAYGVDFDFDEVGKLTHKTEAERLHKLGTLVVDTITKAKAEKLQK